MKHLIFTLLTLALISGPTPTIAEEMISAEPNIFDDVKIIPKNKLKPLLIQKLVDEGLDDNIDIVFNTKEQNVRPSHLADTYHVTIEDIDLKRSVRRFTALIAFGTDDSYEEISIKGRYIEYTSIPVLSTSVSHHTVIEEDDIEWINFAKHQLKHDTETDLANIIGKAAKRSIHHHRPIRVRDLVQPKVIDRNDVVDMLYTTDFLEVKMVGIALENGHKGQVIRVRNPESNKIVQAIVEDERLVKALSPQKGS